MSPAVCQGLQTCLEPGLIERRVLRHKLAPPASNFSQSIPWPQRSSASRQEAELPRENSHNEEQNNNNNNNKDCSKNSCDGEPKNNSNNGDFRGWSFLEALANLSHNHKDVTEKEKVYVHPLVKRSSSTLSTKSLEMCTESLGSETGSEVRESSDKFPPLSMMKNIDNSSTIQRSKSREIPTKLSRSVSFPPPLTSIGGFGSFQVRPHREGGRLVMRAVEVPPCNSYFQAERVDGRLRLCLVKDGPLNCDNGVANESKEQACDEEVDKDGVGETEEAAADDDEDGDDVEEEEKEKGIGGNIGNVGCEIEFEEFSRPSRCKEGGGDGNKGMSSWGPFWVATS